MSAKLDVDAVAALLAVAGTAWPPDRLEQHVPWLHYVAAAGRRLADAGLGDAAPWERQDDA